MAKKSKHGGAREGAGSLPRLDKVGNCLRIVRLEADGSEAKGFAQPLYRVVEKGRGYAVLEDNDGTRFKLDLCEPIHFGDDANLHHADADALMAAWVDQNTDYSIDTDYASGALDAED